MKAKNPIQHQIDLKTRLIKNLNREIDSIREDADAKIKNIKFRIDMAQTLKNALEKGRA